MIENLPAYPPFKRPEDWRELDGGCSASIQTRARQLVDDAWCDHDDGKHDSHEHPWCSDCFERAFEQARGAPLESSYVLGDRHGKGWQHISRLLSVLKSGHPLDAARAVELLPEVDEPSTVVEYLKAAKECRDSEWVEEARERDPLARACRYLVKHGRPPADPWPNLGATTLPNLVSLKEFLKIPDESITHRIDGLWPAGGRVVLSAQHKAGKTTMVGNLLRSLVDGDRFLEAFTTTTAERVLIVDNELDEAMLRRWIRDQGIRNEQAVQLISMRGKLSSFDILDPNIRTKWAEHLGAADVLVLDCLRPALDALRLSEDKDAGQFLEALDELTTRAGIAETFVVHHMGHSGERSRGDSRILDWPDAVWKMLRDADDEDSDATHRRYFTAYGRDVDQSEVLLSFDPPTRGLSVAGGSRQVTRAESVVPDVLAFIEANPGASKNAIEKGVEGRADHIRKAVLLAVERGLVEATKTGQAIRHTLTSSTSSHLVPDEWTSGSRDLVPSSIDEDEDEPSDGRRADAGSSGTNPTCELCGQQLMLRIPGRDICERCRRAEVSA